ncbi:hypothetical protein HZA76_00175 [Candidatus Roizmanbacteria bacterium]|nr:hypothetical protein [Candidatus Roizmanbacteria bacterium]
MFEDVVEKIKNWYNALPDKKRHVEFITAVLTVPVLLTVLITNLSNINNNKKSEPTPTATPTEKVIIVTTPVSPVPSESPTLTPTIPECKKEVGPVKILTPAESQLVNKDPVCLNISYQVGEYCSVVYSYRIDEGDWSDYTDKQICLYNLEPGPKTLELKVKNSQSDDEVTLIRNFYYKTKDVPTPTLAITSTPQ